MTRVDIREYYARIRSVPIGAVAEEFLGAGRITARTSTLLRCDCPKHASVSKSSLHIYLSDGRWRCWGCGVGGDVIQLVEFLAHGVVTKGVRGPMPRSHRMARDQLAMRVGLVPLTLAAEEDHERDGLRAHRADDAAIDCLTSLAEYFHETLMGRPEIIEWIRAQWGFDVESVRRAVIGFAPDQGQWDGLGEMGYDDRARSSTGAFYFSRDDKPIPVFKGRVIFPYFSRGRVVYMIGRQTPWTEKSKFEEAKYKKLPVYDPEHRKYISPAINNRALWGEDILTSNPETVVVTEGVTDAIASIAGGYATVSPVTVRFAKKDIDRLRSTLRGVKRVLFVQDNELSGIGEIAALETARALEADGIRCMVATLPLGPDQVSARSAFAELLGAAGMKAFREAEPARRGKILEEVLKGDAEKIDAARKLINLAKIDLCSWYAAGGTHDQFAALAAAARSPIEVLIDGQVDQGSDVEKVRACESILTEIGLQRAAAQAPLIQRLKDKINVPIAVLKREASALARKAARSVPARKSRAPGLPPGVTEETAAAAAHGRLVEPTPGAVAPETAPNADEETCREFVDAEREACALARVQLDWGLMAERIYLWIESKGGRFFRAQDGSPILFWRDEVYEMRSDAAGPRSRYEGLMWRLTGCSPTTSGERRFFAVLACCASDRGAAYHPFPWIATDLSRRVIHVLMGDGTRRLARISAEGVTVVPNGHNADGVILRGDPKFRAFNYVTDPIDLDAELNRLIISKLACPPEHAQLLVDWICCVFMLEFAGTRPMVRLEGPASSGKTWGSKLISTLVYGTDTQKRSTTAANWADSTRNPLCPIDNVETSDAEPNFLNFLLTVTTGASREKRAAGTDTANIIERPVTLIMTTGIEPLAGDLKEMATRSLVINFDELMHGNPILERESLTEIVANRDRILSAILRRTVDVLRLMENDGHGRAQRAIRFATGAGDRRRLEEYLSLMYLWRVAGRPEQDRDAMLDTADPRFIEAVLSVHQNSRTTLRDSSPIMVAISALFVLLEHDLEFRKESGIVYVPRFGGVYARIESIKTEHLFTALHEVSKRRGIQMPFKSTVQFGRRLVDSTELLLERGLEVIRTQDRMRSSVWTICETEPVAGQQTLVMDVRVVEASSNGHANGASNGHAIASSDPPESPADSIKF